MRRFVVGVAVGVMLAGGVAYAAGTRALTAYRGDMVAWPTGHVLCVQPRTGPGRASVECTTFVNGLPRRGVSYGASISRDGFVVFKMIDGDPVANVFVARQGKPVEAPEKRSDLRQ